MNKKLIALAVAGACTAPAAMAQTANPVTLYGRVYVTLEQVEAKGGTGTPSRTRIEDQSSLFGIRGTEDLGGGLRAFFQLETAFRPDSNNTTFAARNSGVGLQGGFGSILLGRWDMPFKVATIAIDPYGDLTLSGITGTLSDGGNFDRRDMNVMQYWSPTFGGFAFRLAGTANENKSAANGNPRDYGANLTFTRGPVYVFAAWEKHKDNSSGNALGTILVPPQVAGTPNYEEEGLALGGSMSFGPIKIGLQHQRIEKSAREDVENWMGNVVFTFGKNQIIFQHMRSEGGQSSALPARNTEPDCESNSIGYQYNFTRRTFFIGSYIRVTNENGATCNFGANRLAIGANQDPQGVFLGIRHVF